MAAEDVEDDVEMETGPFHGSYQRGPHQLAVRRFKLSPGPFAPAKPGRASLPRPDLIGGFGQQFGLLINRMAALAAAFGDLAMGCCSVCAAYAPLIFGLCSAVLLLERRSMSSPGSPGRGHCEAIASWA